MFPSKKLQGPQEAIALLNCRRLPGRLTTGEAAVLLGFQEHDIAALIGGKMLRPLGDPAPNSPKYFAGSVIGTLASDPEWLSKATRMIAKHWLQKNARKKSILTQL
jgi:hypothetical protein